ncbi:hypothetical protein [Allokutzneria albata]|uniref:Secreted protein n=1 Tax=Allokutzneria albata TaxID=211114 RepID=A0A1G9UTP4_ALLAB|nr:hypothetical protein [Allokutzneria albata]SDM63301.1 hypothetical protein SAMN04489726_2620 [Allokutzneria albata]
MNPHTVPARLVVGVLSAALMLGVTTPAHALDREKLAVCVKELNADFQRELASRPASAAMTALQNFGGMVRDDGTFDQLNAKRKLAQCGVLEKEFKTAITLLQSMCKLKPALSKGKGAAYWHTVLRCLVEQGHELGG